MKKDDPGPIEITKHEVEEYLDRLVQEGKITTETRQMITVGDHGDAIKWMKGVAEPDVKK